MSQDHTNRSPATRDPHRSRASFVPNPTMTPRNPRASQHDLRPHRSADAVTLRAHRPLRPRSGRVGGSAAGRGRDERLQSTGLAVDLAIAHEAPQPRDPAGGRNQSLGPEPFGFGVGPFKARSGSAGVTVQHGYIVAEGSDTRSVDMTHSVSKSFLTNYRRPGSPGRAHRFGGRFRPRLHGSHRGIADVALVPVRKLVDHPRRKTGAGGERW